jgi:hypothetical protein
MSLKSCKLILLKMSWLSSISLYNGRSLLLLQVINIIFSQAHTIRSLYTVHQIGISSNISLNSGKVVALGLVNWYLVIFRGDLNHFPIRPSISTITVIIVAIVHLKFIIGHHLYVWMTVFGVLLLWFNRGHKMPIYISVLYFRVVLNRWWKYSIILQLLLLLSYLPVPSYIILLITHINLFWIEHVYVI